MLGIFLTNNHYPNFLELSFYFFYYMFIKTYVDNKACVSFGNFFFVFLFFQHSRRDLCEGGIFSYLLLTRVRTGKVLRPRGQVFLVLLKERKFEVDLAPAIYRYYHVLKSQTLSNFEIYALYGNFLIKKFFSNQVKRLCNSLY